MRRSSGRWSPSCSAEDEADALALANDHAYGLSSAVFTQDLDRGLRFAQQMKAGMTFINEMTVQDEAQWRSAANATPGSAVSTANGRSRSSPPTTRSASRRPA